MSKQVQIRRGTTEEHSIFTGASGEVTYDTVAKTLRVHDGISKGGVKLINGVEFDALAALKADKKMKGDYNIVLEMGWTGTLTGRYSDTGYIHLGGNIVVGDIASPMRVATLPYPLGGGLNYPLISCYNTTKEKIANGVFIIGTARQLLLRTIDTISTGDTLRINVMYKGSETP